MASVLSAAYVDLTSNEGDGPGDDLAHVEMRDPSLHSGADLTSLQHAYHDDTRINAYSGRSADDATGLSADNGTGDRSLDGRIGRPFLGKADPVELMGSIEPEVPAPVDAPAVSSAQTEMRHGLVEEYKDLDPRPLSQPAHFHGGRIDQTRDTGDEETSPVDATRGQEPSIMNYTRASISERPQGELLSPHGREDGSLSRILSPTKRHKGKASKVGVGGVDRTGKGGNILRRAAHNMVEKRYRVNLNDKLTALRDSVPSLLTDRGSLQTSSNKTNSGGNSNRSGTSAYLKKAEILAKAIEYISQLETQVKTLKNENSVLRARLSASSNLVSTSEYSPENQCEGSSVLPEGEESVPRATKSPSSVSPQGLIKVPEYIRRLRVDQPQLHYASRSENPEAGILLASRESVNAEAEVAVIRKSMVGSLAGIL